MNINITTSVSKGWLHQEGNFVFGERYYMDPLYRRTQDIKIDQFIQERLPNYAFYNLESNLAQLEYWQPDYVYVGGIQPNLIIGLCLGTKMAWYENQDIDLEEVAPLSDITSVDELPTSADILAHPIIQQFDAQIESLRQSHPNLTVIPPFFWDTSGRATIHGFVTTSMKFYGEQIFLKMIEEPDFVLAFHNWICDIYIALIQHYSELSGIPVTSVHVGECSGTMISGRYYGKFVVPFLNKLADSLGPIRLHSCGLSNHLLKTMSKIDNLRVLDTGSNSSVASIREILGMDLRLDLAPPLDVLREDAPEDAAQVWLDQVLAENGDGPLQIGFHLEPGYSLTNCLAIHDLLAEYKLIQKGRRTTAVFP